MTREQFKEAVAETMVQFNAKGTEHNADPTIMMAMGLQNLIFAAMLETNLVDKNEEDK